MSAPVEQVPLLPPDNNERPIPSPRAIFINFLAMSFCFALNHGTVTAVLAVASSYYGDQLAGFSSGTLYVLYTLSALLVAAGLVQRAGAKFALSAGLLLYCCYTASFLVVAEVDGNKLHWIVAIGGSAIGGFAAGWLWTAQGAFFARTAQLYAQGTKRDISEVNAWLAGIFSTIYVGLEVICKGLSSLLHLWGGDAFVFGVLTVCAVGSAFCMFFVRSLPPEEPKPPGDSLATNNRQQLVPPAAEEMEPKPSPAAAQPEPFQWTRKLVLAIQLILSNRKMQLLAPINAAFGFTAAFMNQYVNGTPLKQAIGEDNVGYMAAVSPAVAALLSMPYAAITNRIGKGPMMIFGALNYTLIAVCVLAMTEEKLISLGWGLVFLYILGGSGRAVFEGTNKATFADFFPNDKEGAFANVIVFSGGSAALAFFIFPYLTKLPMALLTMGTGILAMFCLVAAFRIYQRERREASAASSV